MQGAGRGTVLSPEALVDRVHGQLPHKVSLPHHHASTGVPRSAPSHTGCSSVQVSLYSDFI